jgi:glycosyltransferase involved in cell wall biosynthesis
MPYFIRPTPVKLDWASAGFATSAESNSPTRASDLIVHQRSDVSESPDKVFRAGFVPALDPGAGGVFQYSASMMEALSSIAKQDSSIELIALVPVSIAGKCAKFEADGWRVVPVSAPATKMRGVFKQIAGEGRLRDAWRWLRRRAATRTQGSSRAADTAPIRQRHDLANWWKSHGIDLLIFPQPHPWAFETGIPSMVAIHDVQHRLQPEFPEVSADGEWERREYLMRNLAASAAGIFVDSDVGREHLSLFYGAYGATDERLHVLPFLPASTMRRFVSTAEQAAVRARYGIPDAYIFYPAQFWSHKNHARIIEAMEQIRNVAGTEIAAVFCGSHAGAARERHFELLMTMAHRCGVANQIQILGFVSDDELAALYAGARALVMPTFFGPTNIPVLEAWAAGCAVITSDIPGVREQAGDAALLVDPRQSDHLATAILRIWNDDALRRTLAERGAQRLAEYGPDEFQVRLRAALQSVRAAIHR